MVVTIRLRDGSNTEYTGALAAEIVQEVWGADAYLQIGERLNETDNYATVVAQRKAKSSDLALDVLDNVIVSYEK